MHLCVFEDDLAKNFLPLTYFRPVFDLRCGIFTLRERIVRHLAPSSASLFARPYLHPLLREENPHLEIGTTQSDAALLVNGRCIMDTALARQFKKKMSEDCVFVSNGEVIAARLSGKSLQNLVVAGETLNSLGEIKVTRIDVEARLVEFPWDIIHGNDQMLAADFQLMNKKGVERKGDVHRSAVLVGKKNISVGKKAVVGPSAVFVAENGPIHIGANARIHPLAYIEGPCSIGDGTEVKSGARITSATTIGPRCKVGGEIQHSIVQAHSSKQHDGFVGHSFIGEWVNLGAGTTTSNLKNTYGSVKVTLNGSLVDSGLQFLGSVIGDHAKTSINTSLSAGTLIGASSNLLGPGIHHGMIRSFSWGNVGEYTGYDLSKALAVAAKVMARRGKEISPAYDQVFRTVFDMTNR